MQQLTTALIKHLPLHAEESTHQTALLREALEQRLQQETQKSITEITLYLSLVERIFVSLAVLNPEALHEAEWRFVSFPAQLVARALLQVLVDPNQNLLETHFWQVPPLASRHKQEKQHNVLKALEQNRVKNHQLDIAKPIRHCSVSAILLRLEQGFLLHRRTAEAVRDGNGEYNFIGGRTKLEDMVFLKQHSLTEKLFLLENPEELPQEAIENTLKREIREETSLQWGKDYQFTLWKKLPAYNKLSGAFYRYSFTEYHFHFYTLSLTKQGVLKLKEFIQSQPESFARFNPTELLEGKTPSGKLAYVHALQAHLKDSMALQTQLAQIPNAFTNQYSSKIKAVVLPCHSQHKLRYGELRHEKTIALSLNDEQCQLLCLLGAYAKGFKFTLFDNQQMEGLAYYQWVKVINTHLWNEIQKLAHSLEQAECPLLEIEAPHYVRLNIEPSTIFFHETQFSYHLKEDAKYNWRMQVTRKTLQTAWATIEGESCEMECNFGQQLVQVAQGKSLFHENKSLDSNIRKQFDPNVNALGLRKLVRIENKYYRFSCDAA